MVQLKTYLGIFEFIILYIVNIYIASVLQTPGLILIIISSIIFTFRYLYECVYGWLISTLSRADGVLQETANLQTAGGKRRPKPAKSARKPRPHAKDALKLQALQQLCGGYFKVSSFSITS